MKRIYKNNIKNNSMYGKSKRQDRMLYLLFSLFLLSLVILTFCRISISQIEKDSSELFVKLNKVAITVLGSSSTVSSEVIDAYEDFNEFTTSLELRKFSPSRFLVYGQTLPMPSYKTEDGKNEYQDIFRTYAASVRSRSYGYVHFLLSIVYVLIGFMFFLIIILYFLYKAIKSSLNNSLYIMQKGIEIIDSRLNLEDTVSFSFPENAPKEILDLSRAIYRVEKDIEFDQQIDRIESNGSISEILENLATALEGLIPLHRIAVAFNDNEGRVTAESAFVKYQKVWLEPGYTEKLNQTSLKRLTESGKGRIMNDLPAYSAHNNVSESTKLILKEGIQSSITIPLQSDTRCLGFLFISSLESNVYNKFHLKVAQRISKRLQHRFFHEYLSQELIAETANSFVGLMNQRDNETSDHISRMSHYSFTIAKKLSRKDFSISPGFPREILWFAPLHDIGKIGIPDNILLKEGPLSVDEFDIMKQHVDIGFKIVQGMNNRITPILNKSSLKTAEDIIQGHHEKFDGSGYPLGLKGREIPLAGRIAAIADVFDALTSKRPYKEAYTVEKSLEIMTVEMAGSFDPYLLDCFRDSLDEILEIYRSYRPEL